LTDSSFTDGALRYKYLVIAPAPGVIHFPSYSTYSSAAMPPKQIETQQEPAAQSAEFDWRAWSRRELYYPLDTLQKKASFQRCCLLFWQWLGQVDRARAKQLEEELKPAVELFARMCRSERGM